MALVCACAVTLALIAELSVRWFGLTDFPVYEANNRIGYIPAANQQGSFLGKNDWQFNSLHMGAGEFLPTAEKKDILLIGDSIVLGGNPVKNQDKLGPQYERELNSSGVESKVWPISAGSWALLNELAWVRENPRVMESVDEVVFVLNSADFDLASSWACEFTHPRRRPDVALWYLFNKYVYAFEKCGPPPGDLLVPHRDLEKDVREYMDAYSAKTRFVLYPDFSEAESEAQRTVKFERAHKLLQGVSADVQDFRVSEWRADASIYRDGIHPTVYGSELLARFLADHSLSSGVHSQP